MKRVSEADLYRLAESSAVFELPIEKEWDLNNPVHRIDYTVAVFKLLLERL